MHSYFPSEGLRDGAGGCLPAQAEAGHCGLDDLRARAADHGAAALDDADALTLFLAEGRGAAGYARRLLARFGSLPEVLGAPRTDLVQVVPPKVAQEIELLHHLHRRALATPLRRP